MSSIHQADTFEVPANQYSIPQTSAQSNTTSWASLKGFVTSSGGNSILCFSRALIDPKAAVTPNIQVN